MKPDNQKRNNQNGGGPNNKKNLVGLISIILWALILTLLLQSAFSLFEGSDHVEIPYSTFREWVRQDYVESVDVQSNQLVIDLKNGLGAVQKTKDGDVTIIDLTTGEAPAEDWTPPQTSDSQSTGNQLTQQVGGLALLTQQTGAYTSAVTAPPFNDFSIIDLLDEHGVEYGTAVVSSSTVILSALVQMVLPFIIMVVAMVFLFRFMSSKMGGGGLGGVGKANAKVYVEKKTGVTFKDVAGQDEAKESLVEIIDFLHNPQKYTEIGAKLPKGALLVGPPGTGKTLLAKAVAGEAGVPFFSISGSDFVEMFVGMGAARVRDLFKEAAKMAPCIIFIDEIDTIGKSRDNRMGGNDEREQTLNQLLAELDGFDPGKGIIVLGATNRPEVLDKALLRPGRFDRRITIDRPNLAGRLATLQVHTRKIKLAEDVDLKKIALATAGCVGADLANLVNEAALRAVRHGRRLVTQEDLLASFEFVIAGSEKKNSVLTEFEKKLVAYHEVGHAMVAYKQKNSEPVQKITIVPHTQGALGYTLLMPEEDKTELRTRDELLAKITVSMGGRAAEQVVLNTMTNGASQDIQDATSVARSMVTLYGMSDRFGMMGLASRRSQYLDGGYGMDCAQNTAADVDAAVHDILEECYRQAVQVIKDNREDMDKVVAYLLEKETITGAEMIAILEGRDPSQADNYAAMLEREEARRAAKEVKTPDVIPMPGETEDSSAGNSQIPPEGKPRSGGDGELPH
ncbi:ATP-dependent zinc metalloprotease FtsH [uncultured Pseudoflavonifractor sp.]|uniref:ATP-dependent zinc metalloprotease FtsH n=1 Tax=uncultured Pseudoflavonifractor sp. TaxID=1221379 RepID=UPI0025F14EA1|nr:ATP-dependent zinc metalloprotease FtsH [uncultured Pseudoflavonifractor sp.]